MKAINYINVVEKLNDELYSACNEELYNQGICFEYSTSGYADIISFLGTTVWCSEFDDSVETEEEVEHIIKEKVLVIIKNLCKWQGYDGF